MRRIIFHKILLNAHILNNKRVVLYIREIKFIVYLTGYLIAFADFSTDYFYGISGYNG